MRDRASISQYNGVSKIDIVSIESVGEVNIVKGILPAEYGNAMAGNLNIITKAGSNAWHGSLFHRYEGAGLVAKPFFLKEKPDVHVEPGRRIVWRPAAARSGLFLRGVRGYRLERALELNANVPTPRFRDLLTDRHAVSGDPAVPRPVSPPHRTVCPPPP